MNKLLLQDKLIYKIEPNEICRFNLSNAYGYVREYYRWFILFKGGYFYKLGTTHLIIQSLGHTLTKVQIPAISENNSE